MNGFKLVFLMIIGSAIGIVSFFSNALAFDMNSLQNMGLYSADDIYQEFVLNKQHGLPVKSKQFENTQVKMIIPNVYVCFGFSNTFMVTTDQGVVIIDTSSPDSAPQHYELLKEISDVPVRYMFLNNKFIHTK